MATANTAQAARDVAQYIEQILEPELAAERARSSALEDDLNAERPQR